MENKFVIREKDIIEFWRKDKTFNASLKQTVKSDIFSFFDGPPFATGLPHYGHLAAGLMKDVVPRYQTMKGRYVVRRWGWDCHGLPVENLCEKEMGLKSKKDIEDIGVDKFNDSCRGIVLRYVSEWRKTVERMGRWVDMDDDYKTMDAWYMESIWWVFKRLWEKELIYQGYKSMHICPRCDTTLSNFEVTQNYKDITDLSVIAKFELVDELGTFILAWTTTPWTLPGNVALAIGNDIEYVIFEKIDGTSDHVCIGEKVIFAEGDIESPGDVTYNRIFDSGNKGFYSQIGSIYKTSDGEEYKLIKKIKGKDLLGLEYEPLFPYYNNDQLKNKENAFKIYDADFVNTEEGTGIVHIAPAFGEDDYNLLKKENLPFVQHVNMDGTFNFPRHSELVSESSHNKNKILKQVQDDALSHDEDFLKRMNHKEVKPKDDPTSTDIEIIKYLAKKDLLFSKEKFEHSYPHCWRCDSPLLNYSTSSWFVAVEKIKKDLLKNTKKINWTPGHIKDGRFGQWLQGARDWSISRQRFWGSVLPIWRCSGVRHSELVSESSHNKNKILKQVQDDDKKLCKNIVVIGSIKELENLSCEKVKDLHKHFVDKITFKCSECDGEMKRIPDVLDCWFESGSMPYAQLHYPFENEKKFKDNFPAEFIAEGVDQTRAWFYYMHVLATALKNKSAFKNVIVNGIVLAQDGKKMAKRLQNYPDPMEMFEKYGADAVRYYLATSTVMRAEDLNFSEKGVDEVVKKVILMAYNVLAFYKMYETVDGGQSSVNSSNVLDKWIMSKTEELTKEVTDAYDSYDLNRATRPIMEFVNELSTWYLRRSRDRFKGEDESDKQNALATLRFVLERLSLVIAPVMPFTAEHVWQELGNKESVHLQQWPKSEKADQKILEDMELARKIVELGLCARADAGIKIRQPLGLIKIFGKKLPDDYVELIKDELNIKQVEFIKGKNKVEIDTEITDDLQLEGHLRELVRSINAMRKKQGLTPGDVVVLKYQTQSDELKKVFDKYSDELKKSVIASEISEQSCDADEIEINGEVIKLLISNCSN